MVNSIEAMKKCINYCKPVFDTFWKITGIYIIWMFIHFFSAHLYTKYCTSYTLFGFITAPILVATPHCTGLRWCIVRGADTIISMWIVLGTWAATKIGGFNIM